MKGLVQVCLRPLELSHLMARQLSGYICLDVMYATTSAKSKKEPHAIIQRIVIFIIIVNLYKLTVLLVSPVPVTKASLVSKLI